MRHLRPAIFVALLIVMVPARSQSQSPPTSPPAAAPPSASSTPVAPPANPPPSPATASPANAASPARDAAPVEFPMIEGRTTATTAPCAQPPGAYLHDGFYLRLGNGFGYVATSGDGPLGNASVSGVGPLSFLAIGGNVERGLVVGGTIGSATTRQTLKGAPAGGPGKVTAGPFNLGAFIDWFPNPTAGWHVGGSLGLGGPSLSDDNVRWAGIGLAGSVFGGYDAWIGPEWSLGVSLLAMGSPQATLKDTDQKETGYQMATGSIGILGTILYH
jgi:hypothetical protein